MWGANAIETVWQDVRYAVWTLRRAPGFTAVAVLSLALGIGANTAVFSLINALMLRLLPVQEPQKLVTLLQHYPGEPRGGFWSGASYEYYRDHNHIFSGLIAASAPTRVSVLGEELEPETVTGESVSANFFSVLGVKPAIGRLIDQDDARLSTAAPDVALVSWSYWKNRFNLNPTILGKRITVQGQPVTIVGVTPPEFFGLQVGSRTEIWLPLTASTSNLALIGRLKPGVFIEQARAEMTVLYRFTIEERASASKDSLIRQLKVEIEPARAGLSLLRDRFAKPLLVLMGLVSLILLIACTNLAGLLLARATVRQHEVVLRASLGASPLRLMGQALTESLLLSGAGSLLGICLAYFGASSLVRVLASGRQIIGLPQPLEIPLTPDMHVLLFSVGVALLAGVLFGLAPAWNACTWVSAISLREIGRSGATRFRQRFGKMLVMAQVGLSVVLLSAAGLFVHHLSDLQHVDLGFRRDHILLVTLDPSRSGYGREALSHGYQELLGRLEKMPDVHAASLSAPTPLSGAGASGFASAEGYQERPEDRRYISVSFVGPKYFETVGIPLLVGRDFNFQDEGQRRVAIINQAMAHYYFPAVDPIGKRVTLEHVTGEREDKTYEIVGVVGDSHLYEIREAVRRTVYLSAFRDGGVVAQTFVLRTNVDPESVTGDVRSIVREVLKTVPVARVTTLSDQIDASIVPERLIASLSGLFGTLGSLLAALGLYGLLAYTVARRVTEFGIRSALGATRGDLIRMVIKDAMILVGGGLIIGGPVAFLSEAFAGSFISDVQVKSVAPIVFGVLAMAGLALIAAILPARRAAQVDPMEALRQE
jgi:putative ABC transport system permease protein